MPGSFNRLASPSRAALTWWAAEPVRRNRKCGDWPCRGQSTHGPSWGLDWPSLWTPYQGPNSLSVGSKVLTAKGALFDDLVPDALGLVGVWEHFIGNTDWSIAAQHNILLLQDTVGRILPVPYDFDWSGAVDARYAFPDGRFKLNSVTTRLYRGECRDEKGYAPVLARYMEKRAAIDSIFATMPQFTPDKVKKMRGYFDEFWKLAANPKSATREFRDNCQQRGN